MLVPEALWLEAPKLARLMSQNGWQGPGVRFRPFTLVPSLTLKEENKLTARKLIKSYLYRDGSWEDVEWFDENRRNTLAFEIGCGCHDDEVELHGFPHDDNTRIHDLVGSENSSQFSAAYKWGYSHCALYGSPSTHLDSYVAVLEIAEDAYEWDDHTSPYPYAVVVQLAFTTHLVFTEGFPDLVGLLDEVLPLVNPTPERQDMYRMHDWKRNFRNGLKRA